MMNLWYHLIKRYLISVVNGKGSNGVSLPFSGSVKGGEEWGRRVFWWLVNMDSGYEGLDEGEGEVG